MSKPPYKMPKFGDFDTHFMLLNHRLFYGEYMKGTFRAFAIASLAAFLTFSFSCSKEKSAEDAPESGFETSMRPEEAPGEYGTGVFADDLDYTPEKPESRPVAGKLSASAPAASGTSQAKSRKTRSLSEFKTSYSTKRKNYADFSPFVTEGDSAQKKEPNPLTLLEKYPVTTIRRADGLPVFQAVFSEPVRAMSALSDPKAAEGVMKIEPGLAGKFRWVGTDQIVFEASEDAEAGVEYKISIDPSLKSIAGATISGETEWTVQSEPIVLQDLMPGSTKENRHNYYSSRGTPPGLSGKFVVRLNTMLTVGDFKKLSTLKAGEEKIGFSAECVMENRYGAKFDEKLKKSSVFAVDAGKIENNKSVTFSILQSKKPGEAANTSRSYMTLRPFTIERISEKVGSSSASMTNPIFVWFNQIPDEKTLPQAIRVTDPDGKDIPVTSENVSLSGATAYIHGLSMSEFGKKYTVEISKTVRDVYSQELTNGKKAEVRLPDAKSYLSVTDSGNKMLEWQYPHKIAFDYQNLQPASSYNLYSVSDPLRSSWMNDRISTEGWTEFPQTEKNKRRIAAVDLDPYLDEGFGFVSFETNTNTLYQYYNWSSGKNEEKIYNSKNRLTVQVTDLGITTRIGINRAVVMVRSLSTNMPVSGADVLIYENHEREDDEIDSSLENPFAVGKTDSNGLAVIKFDEETMGKIERYKKTPAILVRNGKDRATFVPDTHGYNWNSIHDARETRKRIFMFTDRGVYKPGETVSFRGIDKNQKFGKFESYRGGYKAELMYSTWRESTVYGTLEGTTSDSGGFYGSFTLPDDLDPGNYTIRYTRDGGDGRYGTSNLYFMVAYFEPLKIQASAQIAPSTHFMGEDLGATIEGSYLAGGALADASYEATWLRRPFRFSPDTAFTSGYFFGPEDIYEAENVVSQNTGSLGAEGTAADSVYAGEPRVFAPYRYTVSVSVTDISNQRVTAENSAIVHSSRFYIGAKKGKRGFVKNGEKSEFTLVLSSPDGQAADIECVSGDITADFSLVSWELTNQNGLNDEIYSSYERVVKSVRTESIQPKSFKDGMKTISFTPKKSGLYYLTLTGRDTHGNQVRTEYDFYVTGSDYYWHGMDSNELNLTADQDLYNPGDVAQILLSSPLERGDYLITVEREGIYTQSIRHFDSSCSVIEVPIAREFVPVVYVSVSSYSERNGEPTHQYGEKDTGKPKGYYGVTQLFVDPYVRAFSVAVESDKQVYRPGEEATITLRATRAGKPVEGAELTLMAVDRAVLDLINYHVPNPVEFFYDTSYFQNYVQGGDSRDFLMDPVTYAIKNLQGGDAEADAEKEDERKEFKPTALFEPMLLTDSEGIVRVTFKLPDNLTTFRITAVGAAGERFAIQEGEIGVRNPVNVQSVQPRRLRVRDTAECGVLVTNLDSVPHSVKIGLSVRKPEGNYKEDADAGLKTVAGDAFIDGMDTQTIDVPSGASYMAYFDVAATRAGNVELVYNVESDILNERLVSRMLIESSYAFDTVALTGATDDTDRASERQLVRIPSWAQDGEGSLSVTLDATRLGTLSSAVGYVFDYPYGCIEQRTSGVLPLVIFEKYIDVFGMDSKVENPKQVVLEHFKFLKKHQNHDGGFAYWPDSSSSILYPSLRVASLCAYARERGYSDEEISIDIDSLLSYIEREGLSNKRSETFRAQVLYILSVCERYHDYMVDSVYESVKGWDAESMAYCGLYYAGQDGEANRKKAEKIATDIRNLIRFTGRSAKIDSAACGWGWFSSEQGALSLSLSLFAKLNPKDNMVDRLLQSLLLSQKKGYWQSTATTALVLESVYTYIKARSLDAVDFRATAEFGGQKLAEGSFSGPGAKPVTRTFRFDSKELSAISRDRDTALDFSKNGTGTLYYTALMRYALPDELQNARDEGLRVSVQITESESGRELKPSDGSKLIELESGTTYTVRTTLSTGTNRDFIAMRVPVPSGCEILDAALATGGRGSEINVDSGDGRSWTRRISSRALYDNEARFFWDSFYRGSCTVEFKIRAARRGVYPVPPATAELMYEPELFGRADGYLFVVK